MVDSLRHDLIQVVRRCGKLDCVITQKDINKILNGKFQEVVDDYAKSPKKVKAQRVDKDARKADAPVEVVDDTPEPVPEVHSDNDERHDQDVEFVEHKPTAIPEREPTQNSKFF